MTEQEIEAVLTDVLGIGPWTARRFLLVALDRPDVFLFGDLALRRTIRREYAFDHLPTDEERVELSDRGRPYRSLAFSYLFASQFDGQNQSISGQNPNDPVRKVEKSANSEYRELHPSPLRFAGVVHRQSGWLLRHWMVLRKLVAVGPRNL